MPDTQHRVRSEPSPRGRAPRHARALGALTAAWMVAAPPVAAQHAMPPDDSARAAASRATGQGMSGMPTSDRAPMSREAGGTAWQPDATPLSAAHATLAGWMLMLHGSVAEAYLREQTPRGGWMLGSVNWGMAEADRAAAGGRIGLVAGASAETLTLSRCGYPLLLAVGPTCSGNLFGDFQHPHPPIMELAARYERPLAGALQLRLYGGPVGEPALGPPSYLHRLSAAADPVAPITFHEMNPAHASDGVLTAGVASPRWQLEASAFSGTQADPRRVLPQPHALNSASARLSFNPGAAWSLQLSGGRIAAGAGHHAGATGPLHAFSASASYHRLSEGGYWATTAAWARLSDAGGAHDVALLESALALGEGNTFFARAEGGSRGLEHIDILENPDGSHVHIITTVPYHVAELTLGYVREVRVGHAVAGAGARGWLTLVPPLLAPDYGRRAPAGWAVFVSVRPAAARPASTRGMAHEH